VLLAPVTHRLSTTLLDECALEQCVQLQQRQLPSDTDERPTLLRVDGWRYGRTLIAAVESTANRQLTLPLHDREDEPPTLVLPIDSE
jgi:hypothetical protein